MTRVFSTKTQLCCRFYQESWTNSHWFRKQLLSSEHAPSFHFSLCHAADLILLLYHCIGTSLEFLCLVGMKRILSLWNKVCCFMLHRSQPALNLDPLKWKRKKKVLVGKCYLSINSYFLVTVCLVLILRKCCKIHYLMLFALNVLLFLSWEESNLFRTSFPYNCALSIRAMVLSAIVIKTGL